MYSWQVGKVRITRVVELEATGGSRFILPDATPDACREMTWMQPHFCTPDGKLKMSVHALVIDTGSRRIVVDTCIAWSSKGEWVRERFPDFYTGDSTDAPGASGVS